MKLYNLYDLLTKQAKVTKSKEYAPGIPSKQKFMETSAERNPFNKGFFKGMSSRKQTIPFTIQEHHAERAGKHYDLRLIKGNKAYSWALRYLPQQSGEKRLAVAQPVHTKNYATTFEGNIPEGYGKGDVTIFDRGKATVNVDDKGNLKLDILNNTNDNGLKGKMVMINTGNRKPGNKDWLIIKK